MLYPVQIIQTPFGQRMKVTVDYGTARNFLTWDDDNEAFVVHEGEAYEAYVGVHHVCMTVAFSNSTYREEYNDCFSLTVLPKNHGDSAPTNDTLSGPVIDQLAVSDHGLELGPFNPRQPIPYIVDISITGVVTIGWDRAMTVRTDAEQISKARVGIK